MLVLRPPHFDEALENHLKIGSSHNQRTSGDQSHQPSVSHLISSPPDNEKSLVSLAPCNHHIFLLPTNKLRVTHQPIIKHKKILNTLKFFLFTSQHECVLQSCIDWPNYPLDNYVISTWEISTSSMSKISIVELIKSRKKCATKSEKSHIEAA